jgi:hypothetical protein
VTSQCTVNNLPQLLAAFLQMRHVVVIVDCSKAMEDKDLKPNRHVVVLKVQC